MKIVETQNESQPWRLYGRHGLVCKAETESELLGAVLKDYEKMLEALTEIHEIARFERRTSPAFGEIGELARRALGSEFG